jgi:hypothetical protein
VSDGYRKIVFVLGGGMFGFVIRLSGSIPEGKCWFDGSYGDPGRTGIIEKASVFASRSLAEKEIEKLRNKYPQRTFEIEDAPENSKGIVIGENFWIV